MDKYYTPDLKEFHKDFEYEYSGKKRIVTGEGLEVNYSGQDHEDSFISSGIADGLIRVKSFDAQDLSDLEWEVSLKGALNFRAEKELPFDRKATVWTQEDGKIQIDLKSPNEGKYRKEAAYFIETIFLGHIRNKSEFKRITEQLVI